MAKKERYVSTHRGPEIDAGVDAALHPDAAPAAGSGALVSSGGVAAALGGKEDAMTVGSDWPTGDRFLPNGLYALSTQTGEKTLFFEGGSAADDMIYISFVAGAGLELEFPGTNSLGLGDLDFSTGDLVELIGIWNPALQKWSFVHRSTPT